jgi:hypothetical protein
MINDTTAIKEAAASADIAGRNEDCRAGFAPISCIACRAGCACVQWL